MSQHPRAGQPASASRPRRHPRAPARVRRDPPGPVRPRPARGVRDVRAPRVRVPGRVQRGRTSSPRPRRSAATGRGQGYTGPLFIGRDTHALSEPAWRTALEVLVGERGRRPGRRATTGSRRRRPCRTRSSSPTAGTSPATRRGPRRRDRGHAVAQPARRRRLQVQPAQRRARPTPTSRAGSRTRRTGSSRRPGPTGSTASARVPFEQARAHGGRVRLPGAPTSTTSASVVDMEAIAASGLRLGVDPLGGAAVGVLGRDRRALRPRPHGHQRRGGPGVRRS